MRQAVTDNRALLQEALFDLLECKRLLDQARQAWRAILNGRAFVAEMRQFGSRPDSTYPQPDPLP